MSPSTRLLPSINTTDVHSASGSSSRSRESTPYTAMDGYAAATAAYYDRTPGEYAAPYTFNPSHQSYAPNRRTDAESNHRRAPSRPEQRMQRLDERSPTAYDGLPYDQPTNLYEADDTLRARQNQTVPDRTTYDQSHDMEPQNAGGSTAASTHRPTTQPPPLVYDPDYVIAMHDFVPQTPNATCLSFRAGEVIHVLNRDSTGWWDGELEGRRGWFPSNYISTDAAAFAAAAELAGFTAVAVQSAAGTPASVQDAQGTVAGPSRLTKSPSKKSRSRRGGRQPSPPTDPSDASESVLDRRASCPPMMIPMIHALVLLQNAVKANRVAHFQPSTACIISCVRSVLSTCECLNKDSPHLARHAKLAQQRKKVLSELARLVGQARQASENGQAGKNQIIVGPDGQKSAVLSPERLRELQEMVRMGDQVYAHVRKFLAIAVECGVDLPPDRLFAGAPGMEEATGSPATSSSEDDRPIGQSSATPSAPPETAPKPAHVRRSSSTSALSHKVSETSTSVGRSKTAPDAQAMRSSPNTDDYPSSPSDTSSSAETPSHWSPRTRETSSSTFRPRSTGDLKQKARAVGDEPTEQSSPVSSAAEYARRMSVQRRLSFSKRGVDSQSPYQRSPARDSALPYRKPKYSISSVSSFSSYDSSQLDSSSSASDSGSPYFPSGSCSTPQALATLRITHDRLLSVIAAFIGHIHSHSRSSHASSKGHLIEMTRKTVDQVRYLLTLVDAVEESTEICELKPREMAILKNARVALYNATNDIVEAVKDMMSPLDVATVSEEEEKTRALQAATGTLRAGGECVKSVNMCLSTRIGEQPFIINIAAVPAADTPPNTSPPSASSSIASSSPPRTPKTTPFRRTHSYSISQPQNQGPRTKTHGPSASVGTTSFARRRAQSDATPGHDGSRLGQVGEDMSEDMDEGPSGEGEDTVRLAPMPAPLPVLLEPEVEEDDMTPIVEEPTPTPEDQDQTLAAIPRLVVSHSHPLPPLPPSSGSETTDMSRASVPTTEETYVRSSMEMPTRLSDDDMAETDRSSVSSKAHGDSGHDDESTIAMESASSVEMRETPSVTSALEEKLIHGDLPATPSAPPEFLDAMFDPRDLLVNDGQQLVAASLEVMVIKMAPLSLTPDRSFVVAFLLTFRLFTTPVKLTEALINRWNAQPSPNWPEEERRNFEIKLPFLRIRVARCIKTWIDHYWLPESDDEALPYLQRLVDPALPPDADVSLSNIVVVIRTLVYGELMRVRRGGSRPMDRTRAVSHLMPGGMRDGGIGPAPTGDMPTPIVKRTVHSRLGAMDVDTAITELDPIEVARQLTLMEAKLYGEIPAQELIELGKAGAKSTHVKAISTFSTATTGWVSESILNEQDQKKRTTLLKYFVKLAQQCVELHNYSTMRSILAALDSSTISRLTKTWASLSGKYKLQLDGMRRLADHAKNYQVYRETLRETKPPAVPFLGLYLTDLTFCREGNPNTRPSPMDPSRPLINFIKYYRLARIIQDVQRFQINPYNLHPVPEIQKYLSYVIEQGKSTGDLHDLYRRSLVLEPRQASDAAPPDSKSGLLGWASRN